MAGTVSPTTNLMVSQDEKFQVKALKTQATISNSKYA